MASQIKVAYNSESAPIKATKSLISTMAQAFYERCGVGLLDMDYPVNKNFFGDLVSNSPAIIFKVGIIINLSRNDGHTCFKIPAI